MLLIIPASAAAGGLVLAPLMIRSMDWMLDHQPGWYRRYMDWACGKRPWEETRADGQRDDWTLGGKA